MSDNPSEKLIEFKVHGFKFFGTSATVLDPFNDSKDFEDFDYFMYGNIGEDKYTAANLNLPLHIYKYLICKTYSIDVYFSSSSLPIQVQMTAFEKIDQVKRVYQKFCAKKISMTSREQNFVKSAYGAVELIEIAFKIRTKLLKVDDLDFDKFKEICSDILAGSIGKDFTQSLIDIFNHALTANCFAFAQFLLGMISEILTKAHELNKNSLSDGMSDLYKNLLQYSKVWFLLKLFGFYHDKKMFGLIKESQIPDEDTAKGRMLIDFLKRNDADNEFYNIPSEIENYAEALKIFNLIMKLNDFNSPQKNDEFIHEGLARGYLAAFHESPVKLSQQSNFYLNMLNETEFSNDSYSNMRTKFFNETFPTTMKIEKVYLLKVINYSRILEHEWNNYLTNKSDTKLEKIKEMALKRVEAGEICFKKRGFKFPSKYFCWHLYDLLFCFLRILNDPEAGKHQAEVIAEYLRKNPDQTAIFFEIAFNDKLKIETSRDEAIFCRFLINFCK